MRRAHLAAMTAEDVRTRALHILTPRLQPYGMGDVEVSQERDFDGTDVYRVVVAVEEQVPPRVLIDGSDELQEFLRAEGEDHWIYLSTRRPSKVDPDEDAE